jgi:hypothetical protein
MDNRVRYVRCDERSTMDHPFTLSLIGLLLFAPSIARADEPATASLGGPAAVPVLAMHDGDDEPTPAASPRTSDHLFPGAGHLTLAASSGVPFLAIGEAAYAFTDGFTLGAIAGITPEVGGVGLRPRGVIYSGSRARVFVSVPILYYPPSRVSGDEPWFLANPVLYIEAPVADGWRVRGGPGLVGAACQDSLLGRAHEEHFMGDLWPTIAIGASHPLGAASELFADLQGVLPKGIAFDHDWVGGPPVILSLGIAASP